MTTQSKMLEEGDQFMLDFAKVRIVAREDAGVLPVAVQDADTLDVLIIAYVNQEALDYTVQHGVAAFWSTSRNELWVKGATSGDTLRLVEIRVNCEQNSCSISFGPKAKAHVTPEILRETGAQAVFIDGSYPMTGLRPSAIT